MDKKVYRQKFNNKNGPFYILYPDRNSALINIKITLTKEDKLDTVTIGELDPVLACEDTHKRICQNGGRLRIFGDDAPKSGEIC